MTNHSTAQPKIGEGIFLIKDVSEILRLPYAKVRHWLIEYWNNRFGKKHGGYSFGDDGNKAINFYTLIEFLCFYKLREEGLSAHKIQKIHDVLSKDLKTIYPFAKYSLYTDGKHVWYEHIENLVRIDGKRQISFKQILEPYLKNIDFDKNQIATRYFPIGREHKVVVDPKHQFGQPTIVGTNIKIETIYNLLNGGETKESVSYLYDLSLPQVNDAILYYKKVA